MTLIDLSAQDARLPLYDWPELHDDHDALWALVVDAARERGLVLPPKLNHGAMRLSAWMGEDLVFGQMCGAPWQRRFADKARRLATPNFGHAAIPAGHYFSYIVVSERAPEQALDEVFKGRLAFNGADSQSGFWSLAPMIADLAAKETEGLESGGHRESMIAVAAQEADFAAIDATTFRMAQRVRPELVEGVRIVGKTPPTPAPALVTSINQPVEVTEKLKAALKAAFDLASPALQQRMGLFGLAENLSDQDYVAAYRV